MLFLPTETSHRLKPSEVIELDLSNSIADKFEAFFVFNDGNQFEDISPNQHNVAVTGSPYIETESEDYVVSVAGQALTAEQDLLAGCDEFSVAFRMTPHSTNSDIGIVQAWTGIASSNQILIRGSAGNLNFYTYASGGGQVGSTSYSTYATNETATYVLTYDGAKMRCYKNGIKSATEQNQTGVLNATSVASVRLFGKYPSHGSERDCNADIAFIGVSKRCFSQAEAIELSEHWQQVLKPKSNLLFVSPAAVGDPTLSSVSILTSSDLVVSESSKNTVGQDFNVAVESIESLISRNITSISTNTQLNQLSNNTENIVSGIIETLTQQAIAATASKLLTGDSINSNIGNIDFGITKALSGLSFGSSLGGLTVEGVADVIRNLTGVSSALAQQSILSSIDDELSGGLFQLYQDNFSVHYQSALDSLLESYELESLSVFAEIGQTGLVVSIQDGIIDVLDGNVTRSVTGLSVSSTTGLLIAGAVKEITGNDLLISQESVFSAFNILANGQQLNLVRGDVSITLYKTIDGQNLVYGLGSIVFADSNLVLDITGQTITTSQGVLTIDGLIHRSIVRVLVDGKQHKVLVHSSNTRVLN